MHEKNVPGVNSIIEAHKKLYGTEPPLRSEIVSAWTDMMVIVEATRIALEDAGYEKLDGKAIKKAFMKINNFDVGGIIAPVSFSQEDRRASEALKLYQVKGGRFTPVSDWIKAPVVLPP